MSKLKSPQDKKAASLALDGRNTYGENAKASRKLIPLAKQQSHQGLRREARQAIANLSTSLDEDQLVAAEANAVASELRNRRRGFRKSPDSPLGSVLANRGKQQVPAWFGGDPYLSQEERLSLEQRKQDARLKKARPESAQARPQQG